LYQAFVFIVDEDNIKLINKIISLKADGYVIVLSIKLKIFKT